MPFSVHDNVDHPLSLYAASKKANELMAHTYSFDCLYYILARALYWYLNPVPLHSSLDLAGQYYPVS
jgi:hypothetical protein